MQPSTSTKEAKRRVADTIDDKPSEKVMTLLAALNKAQKGGKEEKKEGKEEKKEPKETKTISKQKTASHHIKTKVFVNQSDASSKKKKPKNTVATAVQRSAAKMKTGATKASSSVGARMSQKNQETDSSDFTKRSRNQSTSVKTNKNQTSKVDAHPAAPQKIPQDVLENIYFRFLANIPDEEKKDNIRICFQIELAQWFYSDFYCTTKERKDCPNLGVREFARQIFTYVREVKHLAYKVDYMIDQWRIYKSNVPTYGAILLDSTLNNVLLVQGFYTTKNKWGFPKGKVNENEAPRDCAIREVREETGFDFSEVSKGKEHKIQRFLNDTMIRLYIATDVPMDFPFSPQTRNEIRDIQWFNVWDLPVDRNDYSNNKNPSNFYTILPFVQDLHMYIKREQSRRAKEKSKAPPVESYFNEITPGTKMQPMPSQFSQSEQQFSSVSLNALFNNLLPQPSSKPSVTTQPPAINSGDLGIDRPPLRKIKMEDNFTSLSNLFPPTTSHPVLSTQSHFRPVENGPAHAGSSIIDMLQTGAPKYGSPQIAQPIAVPAKAAKATPLQSESSRERTSSNKIRLSETSAFTAIQPSRTIASNAASGVTRQHPNPSAPPASNPSVEDMDLELQQYLGDVKDHKMTSKIEKEHLNRLTSSTRNSDVNSLYSSAHELHKISGVGEVQLCQAWKSFKLNAADLFRTRARVYDK
ncbi:unnamed protein product [Auanema sp. JU1783]|nr:unnamed protein product [Auanema sp. JU1783]